jgi:hypothetical protein
MSKAKQFTHQTRIIFRPENVSCIYCGGAIKYCHAVWKKNIITLTEVLRARSNGYRCQNLECSHKNIIQRSAVGETLTIKGYTYSMDVIVHIGVLRLTNNYTREQIHADLLSRGIPISEREIQYLYEAYMALLKCSAKEKLDEVMPKIQENGGIVLSLDGVQPEKGNETLWVVRDVLTGITLKAENLIVSDTENIKKLLQSIKDSGVNILGIVSDAQKSIRLAIKDLFPGIPHQYCQFHYLKDIALPLINEDRTLKTDLKHNIRGIKDVEKKIKYQSESADGILSPELEVIDGYTHALRSILLEDGRAPLDPPGIKVYERLQQVQTSIGNCLKKGASINGETANNYS